MTKTLYHNPRCSKSRAALELLEQRGADVTVIRYLETPPSKQELKDVLQKLNLTPRDIMRKGEAIYKELNLSDESLSDDALIDAMIANPILLERPIYVQEDRAAIGRPIENIINILDT